MRDTAHTTEAGPSGRFCRSGLTVRQVRSCLVTAAGAATPAPGSTDHSTRETLRDRAVEAIHAAGIGSPRSETAPGDLSSPPRHWGAIPSVQGPPRVSRPWHASTVQRCRRSRGHRGGIGRAVAERFPDRSRQEFRSRSRRHVDMTNREAQSPLPRCVTPGQRTAFLAFLAFPSWSCSEMFLPHVQGGTEVVSRWG